MEGPCGQRLLLLLFLILSPEPKTEPGITEKLINICLVNERMDDLNGKQLAQGHRASQG